MSNSWQRRAATRPQAVEATTLVLLFALTAASVLVTRAVLSGAPPLWPGIALAAVACAALHWRRERPLSVLAATTLCTMVTGALGYLLTVGVMVPLLVAQYSTSVRTPRRTSWNSALAAAAGMVVTGLLVPSFRDSPILGTVNPVAMVMLAAALGAYVRVRRQYAVARAEHTVREREEETRHRVIQERMRIARELHDVVAHHLTLADAQAGTAAHLAHTHPDQALGIIAKLPETTAQALRELKAAVGMLRQDNDTSDLTPAPGLDRLPDLVEACAMVGLEVTVSVEGERRPLPPVLDLTAYRIVQEALTNVTKHAATRTAQVRLAYTPHYLTLTVTNATPLDRPAAPATSGGGFGLLGMRERAAAAGGTFHAGRRPHGGFEVACTLPLHHHGALPPDTHDTPPPHSHDESPAT
ncbi:sensor histidine kinase [Streptomyces sp. NPDC001536]|uniref:sensor histidine kinase n=1 Tax=Streptomyces sp. NPDC001536 TaxID=3364583 RepID=UPI0036A5C3D3